MLFVVVSRHHVSHVHVINLSSSAGRHVLCCCVIRHHVSHVHVIDLSYAAGRHVICCCVSAYTCYKSFPRQEDMFFVAMCLSASCFPCTCYISFFLGRKTCSLLLCLSIMLPHVHVIDLSFSARRHVLWQEDMFFVVVSRHHVSHVHVINLSSSAGRHVLCCCVSASCFPCTFYRSFLLGIKTCSLLLCLSIMFPMYML